MADFQQDVNDRFIKLKQAKELADKKIQFNCTYSRSLIDADWNDVKNVNDFQTAFLDLLNEKHPTLKNIFQKPLEETFFEMYSNSDDKDERNYKPKDELVLHKIQLPSEISDDWQLMFEMNSDVTIFHVEFEGWTYKTVGITH